MKKVINFSQGRYIAFFFSLAAVIGLNIFSWQNGGLNYGIDFTSGINYRFTITDTAVDGVDISADTIRQLFSADFAAVTVQRMGDQQTGRDYQLQLKSDSQDSDFFNNTRDKFNLILAERFGDNGYKVLSSEFIGSRVSDFLTGQTFLLVFLTLLLILIYIWFRFRQLIFALAAIIALLHDLLFAVGFIGAARIEVVILTVAALLTIIGYSLNDTIVIFDRIRENSRLMQGADFIQIVNASITQSLSRTIITSLTTLLAISAVLFFADGAIRDFAMVMVFGVFVGTYSSIFIASAVVVQWQLYKAKKKLRKQGRVLAAAVGAEAGGERKLSNAALAREVEIPMIERKKRRSRKK